MVRKKYAFIVNPIAGSKSSTKYFDKLKAELQKRSIPFSSIKTKWAGHASELVQKLLKKGEALIVSVGGDGTFNEVASILVGTNQKMAHIPRGSGNGLARMLKIPHKIGKVVGYLESGTIKEIDVGRVNNDYFFCTCGFGFDALIAHRFDGSKKRGLKGYVRNVIKSFFSFKGVTAQFTLDGKAYKGNYFAVTIANANQYGNDAFIAPKANLQDGLLDVTIIKPFPLWYAPLMAIALFGNWIHKARFVETRKAKKVELHSISSPYFHRDGDVYPLQVPATLSVFPSGLYLQTP